MQITRRKLKGIIKEEIDSVVLDLLEQASKPLAVEIREYMNKPKIALALRFRFLGEYSQYKKEQNVSEQINLAQIALQAKFNGKTPKGLKGNALNYYETSKTAIFKHYKPEDFNSSSEFIALVKRAIYQIKNTRIS